MTTAVAPVLLSGSDTSARQRTSLSFVITIFLIFAGIQFAVYVDTFKVLPAADDFDAPLFEILRGQKEGWGTLITQTSQPANYRPMQSILTWFAGTADADNPLFGVHLLHFISAWAFLAAGLAWAKILCLRRIGVIIVAIVLSLHPVLAIMIGSIDGFSSLLAPSLLWLAACFAFRDDNRMGPNFLAALCSLILAFGVKEYVFGGALVLPMVSWYTAREYRFRRFLRCGLIVGALVLAWLVIRSFTMPPAPRGIGGYSYVRWSPLQIATNYALFVAALGYWGNTVSLFIQRSPILMAGMAISCLLSVALAVAPFVVCRRSDAQRKLPWFLLAALLACSLPAGIAFHVSEMYVASMLLPLALLVALSFDHLAASRWGRMVVVVFVVTMIAVGTIVGRSKTDKLVDMGKRAEAQAQALIRELPDNLQDGNPVVLVFLAKEMPERAYSVFALRDNALITQRGVMKWILPKCKAEVKSVTVASIKDIPRDMLASQCFIWNTEKRAFYQAKFGENQ